MSIMASDEVRWSEKGFCDKVKYCVTNITVEPILLCYITPLALGALAIQNLILEKACLVKLGYSEEVCSALAARQTENYMSEEVAVQQAVAKAYMIRAFQHLIPGFTIMFLGSWSDRRRRRKPLMLLTLIGEFLCAICGIICAYFFYEVSLEMTVILDAFFPTLFGGSMTMTMSAFSYIGDITTEEFRTLRIGIVNIFYSAGSPFGTALSGISYKAIGFIGVFGLSAFVFVIGFIYCLIRIKDSYAIPICKFEQQTSEDCSIKNKKKISQDKATLCDILKDVFDLSHFSDTFHVVSKPRPKNFRKRLILLMIAIHVIDGPAFGEGSLCYLFVRIRFNWDEVQYSYFATYVAIVHIIGTAITVGVLSQLLKFDDAMIGVVSCISRILAGFLYAFARSEWQMFLAPILDIFSGSNAIAMKSIASKLVPPEELGKVYSLFATFGSIIPLLYGPMFAFIYAQTVHIEPGAFFVIGGFLIMPATVIFWWLYLQSKADRRNDSECRKSSLVEDNELSVI